MQEAGEDHYETARVARWVEERGLERVALQFPDDLIGDSPEVVARLAALLPNKRLFVLGDSTYGNGCVDEVAAQHYAGDGIVQYGTSDQLRAGSMPVLSIFGKSRLSVDGVESFVREATDVFDGNGQFSVIMVLDTSLQHAHGRVVAAIAEASGGCAEVLVTEPTAEALVRGLGAPCRRDFRFGAAPISAWWATVGPTAMAASAKPEPMRICGRHVRAASGSAAPRSLTRRTVFAYVGPAGSALERRLLLRHASTHPVWRLEPNGDPPERLRSNALLMRCHRRVELAKAAGVFGLLLVTSAAQHATEVASRLEALLRQSGRQVFRMALGKISVEKLGNFPEVECFVSLAGPEDFPFEGLPDCPVPIASPYEVEVALGAREWTGDYVTDLDELLESPAPMATPNEEAFAVQTLGASARVRTFGAEGGSRRLPGGLELPEIATAKPAALATRGLHGVASKYDEEPEQPLANTG